jgi:16S rRNA (adenine1518-N6/adenine1519-N6)-dimethyltransferase
MEAIPTKKSLGQHFLHSQGALDAIVEASTVAGEDVVLEIGPGKGVLTEALLLKAKKVVAVEKDHRLIPFLEEKFAAEIKAGKLILIEKDILEFDPKEIRAYASSYKLVANIPYYITGALLRKFLGATFQPERMVVLLQKEVAERIVARDKKESLLSMSVKVYGRPLYIKTVLAGSFVPPPNVDSAILLIESISKSFFSGGSEERFFEILRAGFAHKRKVLRGNLQALAEKIQPAEKITDIFTKLGIDQKARAEDLELNDWQAIAAALRD